MIDVEHGSFDRSLLSQCIFAARSGGIPVLVRMAEDSFSDIQHAVGAGADGIVVPHVSSVTRMEEIVAFIHGAAIERAYAGATRISQLRREPWSTFQARETDRILAIAQIDEPAGIELTSCIAAIDGLDAIFFGQIGLALAMNSTTNAPDVEHTIERACAACRARNLPVGLSLTDSSKAATWRARGANLFLIDSDHMILRKGVDRRISEFKTEF
jgi:2-keto-3-deoxy-L-rhamnonate aldolase RhmA